MLIIAGKELRFLAGLFTVLFILSAPAVFAQSQIVLENNFEKGTEKWESRGTGGVSISSSKDEAATGIKSLKISGRSANWQGSQLNVTKLLSSGKVYKFTVSVKLAKGEKPDEIKMTMQRGDTLFDGVGSTSANPDEWTTFSGKFKYAGGDPYLLIYVEAGRSNTAYFIDDFKIESLGDDIPLQTGIILQNDFEDKTAQNWNVRGDGVQMFSSNAAGSQSLKVSGRTAAWHGLGLDISPMLFKGRTYVITVSARLVKGEPSDSLKISMQETPQKGKPTFTEITHLTTVTDREWVTLSGEYKVTTNDNNLLIYVEAAGATTSFFIDNVVIKMPEKNK